MFFNKIEPEPFYVSRNNVSDILGSYASYPFFLDELEWPTVEHYYQALKFNEPEQRQAIQQTPTPEAALELAEQHKKAIRKDWKKVKETVMTRGVYIKCRTHAAVTEALLDTGEQKIVENAQFDYFWGCGRDGRGNNAYGKVLMAVRDKLRSEQAG